MVMPATTQLSVQLRSWQWPVLIGITLWALRSGEVESCKRFWVLNRCLPWQRVAAFEWNKFFTEICDRHNFESFQGTISRHKKLMAVISTRSDDLLIVGSKNFINNPYNEQPKELKLKIEGPLQPGYDGSIFYLKTELQFNENGIDVPRAQGTFPNWVNGSKRMTDMVVRLHIMDVCKCLTLKQLQKISASMQRMPDFSGLPSGFASM